MANKYETVMVYSLTLGEEGIEAVTEKFKGIIEADGKIEETDVWGKRRLAYPINDELDGHYVLWNHESEVTVPAELERVAKITDGVLRWLTVKRED